MIKIFGTLTIFQADGTTVTLKPGEVVCDQNITLLRLSVFAAAVIGIMLLLALLWINSAAETGLTNLSRYRLQNMRERHEKQARLIDELLNSPAQIASTVNILNTSCLMFITGLVILGAHQFNLYGPEVTAFVLVITFLTLSVSRVVPKGYAIHNPEGAVLRFSGFINTETKLLRPVVGLVHGAANMILRRANVPGLPSNSVVSEEEMAMLANIGEEEGLIETDERQMIRSIFQFGDTVVREVMRPRLDIKAASLNASLNEVLDLIIGSGKSRIPIYLPEIDHIQGILYAKDLLRYLRQGQGEAYDLKNLLRPAYYVPETKKVDQLFAELQKQRVHIAIIVDEYGGTAGLVTIEDLLEEIVGEIQDEYDTGETADFERLGPDEVLVDARLNLGDVNDFFNTIWEAEDIETVGGFVYDKLGRIPVENDQLLVDRAGRRLRFDDENHLEIDRQDLPSSLLEPLTINDYYRITVLKVSGQRLRQLRLEHRDHTQNEDTADPAVPQLEAPKEPSQLLSETDNQSPPTD